MANKQRGRAWKMERTSVTKQSRQRAKSNKYSKTGDSDEKPGVGERSRVWVGGYTREDGTQVHGHYRQTGNR